MGTDQFVVVFCVDRYADLFTVQQVTSEKIQGFGIADIEMTPDWILFGVGCGSDV
jgi:hypothetical protein